MKQSFPYDLCFYGEYCDVLDTLVDDGKDVVITYHYNSSCSTPCVSGSYRVRRSELTDNQYALICNWKSQMMIDPNSNPVRYSNVLGTQRVMDLMISDVTNRKKLNVIFQESDQEIIQIENSICTHIPKWKLRDDQLEWIRYLIFKQQSTKGE